jgi:transcriptional regulator GlxA family with amidase domain
VLHLKRTDAEAFLVTVRQIFAELHEGGLGAGEVAARLLDIVFIRALRAYFDQNIEAADSGWLAAVRDEQIGSALALLHRDPQEPWTTDSLARRVALSRSAFAERFKQFLGEPPLQYLLRLRINTAATRLRSSDDNLKTIARASGYESVAAFVRAFSRLMGTTPGKYRETAAVPESSTLHCDEPRRVLA